MLYLPRGNRPKSTININDFHCAAGDFDEGLIRESAEQSSRASCWSAKSATWLRASAKASSHSRTHDYTRSDKKLGRFFRGFGRAQDGSLPEGNGSLS